jgi:hypothetical protein
MDHGNLVFRKRSQLPIKLEDRAYLIRKTWPVREWSPKGFLQSIQAFIIHTAIDRQDYAKAEGDLQKLVATRIPEPKTFTVYRAAKTFRNSINTGSRLLRSLADAGYFYRDTPFPEVVCHGDVPMDEGGVPLPPYAEVIKQLPPATYTVHKGLIYRWRPAILLWCKEVDAYIKGERLRLKAALKRKNKAALGTRTS